MSEPPPADVSAPAAPAATAGELLKAARVRQGLHLSVLAASLKVAPRKLELIEANRYDELPDATFVRAMALSMCRSLKIDAEPVLARLPQPTSNSLDPSEGLNQPFRDRGHGQGDGPWDSLLGLPALAGLVLVGGALAVYFWPQDRWRSEVTVASDPAASAAVLPAAPVASAAVVETPPPSVTSEAVAPPGVAAAGASAVIPAMPVEPAPAASAPTAPALLGLRASGESWVEVRDGSGNVLLSRTLLAGESAGVDGKPPLNVTIGNAGVTQVTFRGEPIKLTPSSRDNVARLELR